MRDSPSCSYLLHMLQNRTIGNTNSQFGVRQEDIRPAKPRFQLQHQFAVRIESAKLACNRGSGCFGVAALNHRRKSTPKNEFDAASKYQ
jgi:hypothetical protein